MSDKSSTINSIDSISIENHYDENFTEEFSLIKGQVILNIFNNKHYRLLFIPNKQSEQEKI